MTNKEEMEQAHQEYIAKMEEYTAAHANDDSDEHKNFNSAKEEWKATWTKMMEALLVLERLEI